MNYGGMMALCYFNILRKTKTFRFQCWSCFAFHWTVSHWDFVFVITYIKFSLLGKTEALGKKGSDEREGGTVL